MNIGIDFDDVVVDTYEPYFEYAQKYTIEKLKREPIIIDTGNIASSCYCTFMHGWTQAEEDDFWKTYCEIVTRQAKLKTLAKETIDKLRKEGHKIVIITSRSGIEVDITYEYMKKVGLQVDKVITDASEKGIIAKENKLDIFIDDNYVHCKSVSDLGIKTYIMDMRTNRNINDNEIERVYSWAHLYYKISKLYNS